ncbi:aldehyde dehydrogenase family protein, partial [Micromonospora sp. LOL_014]
MTLWHPDLYAGRPAADGPGLLRSFVDGRFVDAGIRFPKVSPVTGETVFEVAEADAATVDAAVAAARAALRGPWGGMAERDRAVVLRA